MFKAAHYRLDWRSELEKIARYLKGRGGVVRVDYRSEDAAPEKFNHILKESFGTAGNRMWLSLRIDREWFTTRQAQGILDELDRLLTSAGFPADRSPEEHDVVKIVADNDVQGNMTTTIQGNIFNFRDGLPGRALAARRASVCLSMRKYIACGGHFMIVVNDAPLSEQSVFWQQIWNAGLSEVVGENLLLVIHSGPKSERRQHQDSPEANETIFIPDSLEGDEIRQEHVYDDLIDVFQSESIPGAAECAATYLANNTKSVLQLHANLSATLMSVKRRLGGVG